MRLLMIVYIVCMRQKVRLLKFDSAIFSQMNDFRFFANRGTSFVINLE